MVLEEKHFEKYNSIKSIVEVNCKDQHKLLSDLKELDKTANKKFEREINSKRDVCTRLEYEILHYKKEIAIQTEVYNRILKEEEIFQNLISEREMKNEKMFIDWKEKNKDYYRDRVYLFQIYKKLKVKDVDSVIKRFEEESIKYEGYNSMVRNFFNFLIF